MKSFIKQNNDPETTLALIERYPPAFLLLTQIAQRARRKAALFDELEVGQAKVGDYKRLGLSETQYRKAKDLLEGNGLATFKGTRKGTIATLCDTTIYEINSEQGDGQQNNKGTNRGRTGDEQGTSNQEGKKGEEGKKEEEKKESKKVTNLEDEEMGLLKEPWEEYMGYKKKEGKGTYKTKDSEAKAFKKLWRLSNGDKETAQQIVDQSIENGWKGLFELKTNGNAGQTRQEKRDQELGNFFLGR